MVDTPRSSSPLDEEGARAECYNFAYDEGHHKRMDKIAREKGKRRGTARMDGRWGNVCGGRKVRSAETVRAGKGGCKTACGQLRKIRRIDTENRLSAGETNAGLCH